MKRLVTTIVIDFSSEQDCAHVERHGYLELKLAEAITTSGVMVVQAYGDLKFKHPAIPPSSKRNERKGTTP